MMQLTCHAKGYISDSKMKELHPEMHTSRVVRELPVASAIELQSLALFGL